jgi:hypothetical protein
MIEINAYGLDVSQPPDVSKGRWAFKIPITPNAEFRIQMKIITEAISGKAHGAVMSARIPPLPLNFLFTRMAVSNPAPTEKTTFKNA